jgi:DNA polymerase-1
MTTSSKPLHLLIDGDVIAFIAAAAAQKIYLDGFGIVQPFAHKAEGEAIVDNLLAGLQFLHKSKKATIYLSDPEQNFRKDILPTYKGNRHEDFAGQSRPLLLWYLKDYLTEKYKATFWPRLEADDVLGILLTEPQDFETRMIAGKDKDFKTVPGLYAPLKKVDAYGKPLIIETTPWEAVRFHLYQVLKGDPTDGYQGCPGMGDTRANELLDNPVALVPQHAVKTSGKNKGEATTKWVSEPTEDYWLSIITHFKKAGLNEQAALVTAQVANILHHDQYNRETGEITLWTPDRIRKGL